MFEEPAVDDFLIDVVMDRRVVEDDHRRQTGRAFLRDLVEELDDIMRKPEHGFDRVAPENVSPLIAYLASPGCRFTGRVFGIEGDDIFLFDGFSANGHFNNGQKQWTLDGITRALEAVDVQDHGLIIVPSARLPGAQPADAVLEALAAAGH